MILCLLNHALTLKAALFDVLVNQAALLFGFSIGRNRDALGIPIDGIAVGCHIGDMVRGEEISKCLHPCLVIRHHDIDIGSLFGQLVAD